MTVEGDADTRYVVPGLQRGIRILQLFNPDRRTITVPDMVRDLDVPRSTVFRLVQTLEHLGLLERAEDSHAYRLASGILTLGFAYLASLDVTQVGRAPLEALRDATGHSAHLVIRDGRDVVVVAKAAGGAAFSGALGIGTRLPAHATVLGRVLLADLSEAGLRALWPDGRLKSYSRQTPTTLSALQAVLQRDQAVGYAVSQSFFEAGISAVAAPVRDSTGRAVAAVNISVQGGQPLDAELIGRVRASAEEISRGLGAAPILSGAAGF